MFKDLKTKAISSEKINTLSKEVETFKKRKFYNQKLQY